MDTKAQGQTTFMNLIRRIQPKEEVKEEKKINKDNILQRYQELVNELRLMVQSPISYEQEREKMATMLGETLSLSFILVREYKRKAEETQKEIYKINEENIRLKNALIEIVRGY